MINKISFTGRETLLTAKAPKVKQAANEFLSASKVYSKEEISAAEKLVSDVKLPRATDVNAYVSPYEPIPAEKVNIQSYVSETAPHGFQVIG